MQLIKRFKDSAPIALQYKSAILFSFMFLLASCGGSKAVNDSAIFASTNAQSDVNQQISLSAAQELAAAEQAVYYLGAGDILQLTVFQVEELNTKVRVNGRGEIILPLLGKIEVGGRSVADVESEVVQRLERDFLQNPQVSLFIEEYRSQQITVMGAVEEPDVYSIRQTRSIFEMLSLAGGLTSEASDRIQVKTTQPDPETGELVPQNLILSVNKLLAGAEAASYLRLSGGDSILVPEAGVVFVEGAVEEPGSYPMESETSVLKAIALAGGVPWTGKEGSVRIIREVSGQAVSIDVDLADIRDQKSEDVILDDGDIVVVSYSPTKRFISGFFRTAGQIFGYQL